MMAPRAKSVSISKAAVSVKDWEIVADNLSKAGWSWGCVAAVDHRQTIFVADAHRDERLKLSIARSTKR
jgi:hypothetical protein